jgi:protein-S-isoprenylcysteine O-methyltransferase
MQTDLRGDPALLTGRTSTGQDAKSHRPLVPFMTGWLEGFRTMPPYGLAALGLLVLYGVQAEVRFGAKARARVPQETDRGSSHVISVAVLVVVFGFVLAMKTKAYWLPDWFRNAVLPGMPAIAWVGVALGVAGLALRLWSVLTLRERYTRTLLTADAQTIERNGPYRWVRHPGYLGSLLCFNGIALASGNYMTLAASLIATSAAYRYRIRVEDEMLVKAFGETYAAYRREVPALIPFTR